MRLTLVVVVLVMAAVLAPQPAPGTAAAPSTPTVGTANPLIDPVIAQRRGGGFRRNRGVNRRPTAAQRRADQRARAQRNRAFRRFGNTVLRVLGIAFLLNLLFGIGPGGSAWFLLVLAGLIALVVLRRRRRQPAYRW